MNIALLLSTFSALAAALGHSWLGETKMLRPLYLERADEGVLKPVATRRVLRAVFHLPSIVWALTGILIFGFVWHGTTPPVWFVVYGAALYGLSAAGNFWGLRRDFSHAPKSRAETDRVFAALKAECIQNPVVKCGGAF